MTNKVSILMNQVRSNAAQGDSRFPDFRLVKLFNDAQSIIRSIIHTTDGTGKFFPREHKVSLCAGTRVYDLPADVYALNSINSVRIQSDSVRYLGYSRVRQIGEFESGVSYGYYPFGKQIRLSFEPSVGGTLIINYSYKIPDISHSVGEIKSISGGKIRLRRETFNTDVDLTDYTEFVTIVDRRGTIVKSGIEIDSFNKETGSIRFHGDIEGDMAGNHVAMGELASTHTSLPEEVIHLLTTMVERRIKAIDTDVNFSEINMLTSEERAQIIALFSETENDVKRTPLEEDNYLAY